ncbi:cyanase [Pseudoroseicyclus aestuarii]|uniref:Cyanate hydratase n=1 Tax=Pseudoroseicyclus aestuarii TaxID=1795041 RepID=A0A318SW07_9RHOB|nr:cyanase [Pseudoroseicyclus aestuarii]PYE84027.1 cyanate lyase [Pseudoroseicyclus aestuarii]
MKDTLIPEVLTKDDLAALILAAKKRKDLTWTAIAEGIGMSPVWTHSACVGMNAMPPEKAAALVQFLDLPAEAAETLAEPPSKDWIRDIPTDPCIYRLYEIAGVYGPTFKALVHEEFGDGIMSAIDFEMEVTRQPDPKGDRVKVELSGKFLPYRTW